MPALFRRNYGDHSGLALEANSTVAAIAIDVMTARTDAQAASERQTLDEKASLLRLHPRKEAVRGQLVDAVPRRPVVLCFG